MRLPELNIELDRAKKDTAGDRADEINRGANKSWLLYKSHFKNYESYFFETLDGRGLNGLIEERKKRGKPVFCLDLMSDGENVLDKLETTNGLAVGLTAASSPEDVLRHKNDKHDLMSGDLTSLSTWQRIEDWIKARDVDEEDRFFNLIVCRGGGGLLNVPKHPDFLYALINDAYKLLSRDKGELVVQKIASWHNLEDIISIWADEVGLEDGVSIINGRCSLRITKTENAPKELPKLDLNKYSY